MKLSTVQRVVLAVYVTVVLCLSVYVPNRTRYLGAIEYSLIWSPPPGTTIDITRLGLEIFAITVLAGVIFVIGDTVWKAMTVKAVIVWKAMTFQRAVAAGFTAILLVMLLAFWHQENTITLYRCFDQ